jgi:transglutaminase-like putative cysteine protease
MAASAKSGTMRAIERYFEVMLFLMVLSGFATLAQTGQLDPVSVLLVIAALTVRGYLLVTQKKFIVAEQWTKYLTLVFALWYFADLFWISNAFVPATVHLVLALLVLRLFSARRYRDFVFLAILAFLLVLAASVLTVDSSFLIGFAAFLLTAVATFILLDMRRSAFSATAHAREPDESSTAQQMGIALGTLTPILVSSILLIAVAIFFVLPRLSAGYLSAYAAGGELSTGFSDHVELGQIGQIQQSGSVVMHIQVAGDQRGSYSELLWRGIALNQFDGRSWSNTERQVVIPRSPEGRFLLPISSAGGEGKILHYRVLLEPLGTNVFFVAAKPRWIQGGYRMVTTDAGGALYDLDREHPVGVYEGESDVSRPTEQALRRALPVAVRDLAGGLSSDEQKLLQLPNLDARIPQLAREITAKSRTPYQRAADLENYLRTHYGYTLDLGHVVPKDPLASFLFERKEGHCEYFASAMAVMLRTQGIPARVINGFRGGEFNDITSQYVVRMRNAHSWVEADIPGYGWMTFDPTPGDNLGSRGRLSRIMLYLDAASSFWREWVINYDFQHQRVLGQQATNSSRQFFERARFWGQEHYDALLGSARRLRHRMVVSPKRWTFGGICLVVLLLAIINGKAAWALIARSRLAAHPERSPQKAASIWYERMTRSVARRGWRKLPTQTPSEFAKSIEDVKLQKAVANFTTRYEKARFGESPEDAQALPHLYDQIGAGRRS